MAYFRMAAGVVMCTIGGWQLATALDDGPGGGGGDGDTSSAYSYQWTANCDRAAQRAFGSAPHSATKVERGMLALRERGCDPNYAPSGTIPMVSDEGSGGGSGGDSSADDWGNGAGNSQMRGDGWGD